MIRYKLGQMLLALGEWLLPFVPNTNSAMFDCRKCGRPTRPQPGGNGLCGLCVFNTYRRMS